ncbi:MAG TPA: hypothetical protein VMY35_11480 [Phycisphaerae bacterium]|nr:hypothetical protein [Phycisphaerae bacterium]
MLTTMLAISQAPSLANVMDEIQRLGSLVTVVLIILVLVGIALVLAHHRLAKNQVELADLVRQLAGLCGKKPGDH